MAASKTDSEDFVPFRDGVPYTSDLVAVRKVADAHLDKLAIAVKADPSNAPCSVAMLWQLALRELSVKSPNANTLFRSTQWQMRQMNTQIASLAQLRHDTILYAKQAMTMTTQCEYAAGCVDPYPEFWAMMEALALKITSVIDKLQKQPKAASKKA